MENTNEKDHELIKMIKEKGYNSFLLVAVNSDGHGCTYMNGDYPKIAAVLMDGMMENNFLYLFITSVADVVKQENIKHNPDIN